LSRSLSTILFLNALIAVIYTYFSFATYRGYGVNITPWQITVFKNPLGEMQGFVISTNYLFMLFFASLAINIAYIIWLNKKMISSTKPN